MSLPVFDNQQRRRELLARIDAFGRALRWRLFARGAARLAGLAVVLFALMLLADWQLDLSSAARRLLRAASVAGLGIATWVWLIRDQLHHWTPLELAAVYDRVSSTGAISAVAPRVATALSLNEEETPDQSSDMAREAIRRSYAAMESLDFREPLGRKSHRLRWLGVSLALALPWLAASLAPQTAGIWRDRWLLGMNTPWPRATTIVVEGLRADGTLIAPQNEPLTLRISVRHKRKYVRQARIVLQPQGSSRTRHSLSAVDAPADPVNLADASPATTHFTYEVPPLSRPTSLTIRAGDARLGPLRIIPTPRPKIESLLLVHQHPWDEAPREHNFDTDDTTPSLLPKTEATLRVEGNISLDELTATGDDAANALRWKRVDERTWTTSWTHERPLQLSIVLAGLAPLGQVSGLLSHPRAVAIGLQRDRPPTVTLRHSGVRRRVTFNATIPFRMEARDDFGLEHVQLSWEAQRGGADKDSTQPNTEQLLPPLEESPEKTPEKSPDNNGAEVQTEGPPPSMGFVGWADSEKSNSQSEQHEFALEPWRLEPGDLIKFTAEARDACYTGEQTTTTPSLTFRVVKADDLFREILLRQQQLRARLRSATQRSEALSDDINLAELPEGRGALIRKLRTVQRDIAAVHRGLDASVAEMEWNQLGGPESLELIRSTVVNPLRSLHDGAIARQLSTLESLDEASRVTAMDRERELVDEMKKILKSMAQWDSFIDVVNQLDSVIKLQKSLRTQAEKLKAKEIDSVFE